MSPFCSYCLKKKNFSGTPCICFSNPLSEARTRGFLQNKKGMILRFPPWEIIDTFLESHRSIFPISLGTGWGSKGKKCCSIQWSLFKVGGRVIQLLENIFIKQLIAAISLKSSNMSPDYNWKRVPLVDCNIIRTNWLNFTFSFIHYYESEFEHMYT